MNESNFQIKLSENNQIKQNNGQLCAIELWIDCGAVAIKVCKMHAINYRIGNNSIQLYPILFFLIPKPKEIFFVWVILDSRCCCYCYCCCSEAVSKAVQFCSVSSLKNYQRTHIDFRAKWCGILCRVSRKNWLHIKRREKKEHGKWRCNASIFCVCPPTNECGAFAFSGVILQTHIVVYVFVCMFIQTKIHCHLQRNGKLRAINRIWKEEEADAKETNKKPSKNWNWLLRQQGNGN